MRVINANRDAGAQLLSILRLGVGRGTGTLYKILPRWDFWILKSWLHLHLCVLSPLPPTQLVQGVFCVHQWGKDVAANRIESSSHPHMFAWFKNTAHIEDASRDNASQIVPDFIIFVYGNSCNSFVFGLISCYFLSLSLSSHFIVPWGCN